MVFVVWFVYVVSTVCTKTRTGTRTRIRAGLDGLLVSKMTFSLEANSPATVFQKAWKLSVERMIFPELLSPVSVETSPPDQGRDGVSLSSIVMRIKHRIRPAPRDKRNGLNNN